MNAPKKPAAMCCVSINHSEYLLPADKGMKLVELLQHAFACSRGYETGGYTYTVHAAPDVELALVKPSQIVMPAGLQPPLALQGPRRR